jgi:hypothetical protein
MLLLGLQALAAIGGLRKRGWPRLLLLAIVAGGLLRVPIHGFSIGDWVLGLSADFSIPFMGLLGVAVWECEFQRKVFTKPNWTAAWIFGVVAGLGLYPFALGWGSFDPYGWGWSFSPLFAIAGVMTAVLLWKQNRFGILLLLAAAACQLHLLESSNYWDYLLDPVYCLTSIVGLGWQLGTCKRLEYRTEQRVSDRLPGL